MPETRYALVRAKEISHENNVENPISIGGQQPAKPSVIKFDTSKQKDIVVGGIRVIFADIKPYTVQYRLEDVMPRSR